MIDVASNKVHDEARQGEAFAPFAIDENKYSRRFYIESYGCAMNFADSEIVASILQDDGFGATRMVEEADLILLNTCSIREKAEQAVRKRLTEFRKLKKAKPAMLVGVLGCMAERLKSKFIEEEKLVDLVVGPDAYRTLPQLITEADGGQKAVNVLLSREETYADISPVRLNSNGITAFVSIMRGCNNMCSFCVVPFTRGRERSRDAVSIVEECWDLYTRGYKEVTLLGQNVDSYYYSRPPKSPGGGLFNTHPEVSGLPVENSVSILNSVEVDGVDGINVLKNIENLTDNKNKDSSKSEGSAWVAPPPGEPEGAVTFALLLEMVAQISPSLRIRFSTSHPKDITDDVLYAMAKYNNICKHIHLPVQSGSTRMLQIMNRNYSREWYIGKLNRIREIIPDCGITSDLIAGFCTETEEDHEQTISLMQYAGYDMSYMYFYSERPGTLAHRRYEDDIPLDVKKRRLAEIVATQNLLSQQSNKKDVGKTFTVLIEGDSKKSTAQWMGRNSQSKVIVFDKIEGLHQPGDFVAVRVNASTQATLIGEIIEQ